MEQSPTPVESALRRKTLFCATFPPKAHSTAARGGWQRARLFQRSIRVQARQVLASARPCGAGWLLTTLPHSAHPASPACCSPEGRLSTPCRGTGRGSCRESLAAPRVLGEDLGTTSGSTGSVPALCLLSRGVGLGFCCHRCPPGPTGLGAVRFHQEHVVGGVRLHQLHQRDGAGTPACAGPYRRAGWTTPAAGEQQARTLRF